MPDFTPNAYTPGPAHDIDINHQGTLTVTDSEWFATTARVRNKDCGGWWPCDYASGQATFLVLDQGGELGNVQVYDSSTFTLQGGTLHGTVTLLSGNVLVGPTFTMKIKPTTTVTHTLPKGTQQTRAAGWSTSEASLKNPGRTHRFQGTLLSEEAFDITVRMLAPVEEPHRTVNGVFTINVLDA